MADNDDLLKKLADNFHELSERERKVLKEKLGIELMPLPTLEQVQAAFRKTRDRIREIERRARESWSKPPTDDDPGGAPPAEPPPH
jgi:DNA-directed RNA polymerase sigma subunit (sigma70/sigma32)